MKAAELVESAEAYAREEMSGQDASHDMEHVQRVRRLALALAAKSGVSAPEDLLVVELAALLHDVKDHKYSGGDRDAGANAVRDFLSGLGAPEDVTDRVAEVVANVSWSKQMARDTPLPMTPELAVVQDADRLDGIGAVGVARCFTFSGSRNRPLYSRGEDGALKREGEDPSSVGHFYDKLLKVKEYINTDAGREEAERRHKFLESFLDQLSNEVEE